LSTIKDVAKLSGVSIATISRVINKSGYVSKDAEDRVRRAMELLSYEPNQVARGLVSKKTLIVGLIVPDIKNSYFADIARGAEDAAIKHGYSLILCNTDWSLEQEKRHFNLLKGRWVEGAIIVGSRTDEDLLISELNPIPYVFVDRKIKSGRCVWVNHEAGGKVATNFLIKKGCKNILHISGPRDSFSAVSRKRGFEIAARESAGIEAAVYEGDYRVNSGYEIARKVFLGGHAPDGIFAANDLMAIGVLQAAKECDIRIPDDLLLVGYDGIEASNFVSPRITTVKQPAYEMGEEAFVMLHDMLHKTLKRGMSKEFEVELIERDSTNRY
jgi:LacI family transcriptional regulator